MLALKEAPCYVHLLCNIPIVAKVKPLQQVSNWDSCFTTRVSYKKRRPMCYNHIYTLQNLGRSKGIFNANPQIAPKHLCLLECVLLSNMVLYLYAKQFTCMFFRKPTGGKVCESPHRHHVGLWCSRLTQIPLLNHFLTSPPSRICILLVHRSMYSSVLAMHCRTFVAFTRLPTLLGLHIQPSRCTQSGTLHPLSNKVINEGYHPSVA